MPERKWIHRSRNGKPWSPKSLNKVIEPSLERTAGKAPLSRVVVVVEVLILLFVVVELVLVVEPVLVKLVLVVIIEVFVIVVEILVVLVVLFLFLFLFLLLLDFGVVLPVHEILLVFDPSPIPEPRQETLLRTVRTLTCETGVVTVGRRSAGL